MANTSSLIVALSLVLCGVTLVPYRVVADANGASDAKAEIKLTLIAHEQANARGEDVTKVSKRLYTEDVIVVGEGEDKAERGLGATIAGLQKWRESLGPNGVKNCKHTLIEPFVASAEIFSSFMLVHCSANPPTLQKDVDARLLVVWKKSRQQWRIALEMWAPGAF